MTTSSFVLAIALITAPPDNVDQPPTRADWPVVREAVLAVAVEWEIVDPRERLYVFAILGNWDKDLCLVRTRYQDLKDAPPLTDCERLPDRGTAGDACTFNRSYRRHLVARIESNRHRADEYLAAISETDQLYQIWDSARDAQLTYYYIWVRRQALQRLKKAIGPEAYYRGEMPPYAPLWRFEVIN